MNQSAAQALGFGRLYYWSPRSQLSHMQQQGLCLRADHSPPFGTTPARAWGLIDADQNTDTIWDLWGLELAADTEPAISSKWDPTHRTVARIDADRFEWIMERVITCPECARPDAACPIHPHGDQ